MTGRSLLFDLMNGGQLHISKDNEQSMIGVQMAGCAHQAVVQLMVVRGNWSQVG